MLVEQILFSLIRSEICMTKPEDDLVKYLSPEMYSQLYVLSQKHDLSHIAASALSRLGVLKKDEVSNRFNRQLLMSLYRDSQKEYALEQVSTILESAEIPHILLKGAVIREFYPQAWMRTSCDIDVLVPEEDVASAIETLCNAGYLRMKDCSTHDHNFMSPNKVHIELHYTLTQDGKISASDNLLESVWNSYVTLEDGCSYRYSIEAEIFILYHLAHMARHLVHGGCGIRPFIDLWLIKRKMTFDNEKLIAFLTQAKLLKFYEIASELSEVWLEDRKHSEKTKHLETYILTGGVYGTISNAAQVDAANGVGKAHSFLNLVFLPKKNLQVLYPNLEKYPVLYPFYQVKRWLQIFNKEKRQKVKYLTDVRNSVSQNEADSAMVLLQTLGLTE